MTENPFRILAFEVFWAGAPCLLPLAGAFAALAIRSRPLFAVGGALVGQALAFVGVTYLFSVQVMINEDYGERTYTYAAPAMPWSRRVLLGLALVAIALLMAGLALAIRRFTGWPGRAPAQT